MGFVQTNPRYSKSYHPNQTKQDWTSVGGWVTICHACPANLAVTTPDVAFGSICPLLKTGGEFHHCLVS